MTTKIITIRWVPPDGSSFQEQDFVLPYQRMKMEVFQTKLVLDGCFVERNVKFDSTTDHGDDEQRYQHGM